MRYDAMRNYVHLSQNLLYFIDCEKGLLRAKTEIPTEPRLRIGRDHHHLRDCLPFQLTGHSQITIITQNA